MQTEYEPHEKANIYSQILTLPTLQPHGTAKTNVLKPSTSVFASEKGYSASSMLIVVHHCSLIIVVSDNWGSNTPVPMRGMCQDHMQKIVNYGAVN